MTKLLKDAVKKLEELPEERQDELAEMLMAVAGNDLNPYQLSDDERTAVEEGLAQVKRGEFATDDRMAALWKRFGL